MFRILGGGGRARNQEPVEPGQTWRTGVGCTIAEMGATASVWEFRGVRRAGCLRATLVHEAGRDPVRIIASGGRVVRAGSPPRDERVVMAYKLTGVGVDEQIEALDRSACRTGRDA